MSLLDKKCYGIVKFRPEKLAYLKIPSSQTGPQRAGVCDKCFSSSHRRLTHRVPNPGLCVLYSTAAIVAPIPRRDSSLPADGPPQHVVTDSSVMIEMNNMDLAMTSF